MPRSPELQEAIDHLMFLGAFAPEDISHVDLQVNIHTSKGDVIPCNLQAVHEKDAPRFVQGVIHALMMLASDMECGEEIGKLVVKDVERSTKMPPRNQTARTKDQMLFMEKRAYELKIGEPDLPWDIIGKRLGVASATARDGARRYIIRELGEEHLTPMFQTRPRAKKKAV